MGNLSSKVRKKRSAAAKLQPAAAGPREAPLGEWESPITSTFITEKAVRLSGPFLRPSDGTLFWLESRPNEGGRQVLVTRSPDGTTRDVTPQIGPQPPFNVRTAVHEYGGGEYIVVENMVYFVNFRDQALYALDLSAGGKGEGAALPEPCLVTRGSEARGERFADLVWDGARQRLIAVSELHREPAAEATTSAVAAATDGAGGGEEVATAKVEAAEGGGTGAGKELPPDKVINRLVAIDILTGNVTLRAGGSDFYISPRTSPSGGWLAWVEWDFPNMPWDHTRLMVSPLAEDGALGPATRLAGAMTGHSRVGNGTGEGSAVQQPVWSADSSYLYYVDDRSGWWNLYRCRTPGSTVTATSEDSGSTAPGLPGPADWSVAAAQAEALCPGEADWGFPAWTLDRQSYRVLADGSVLGLMCDPKRVGTCLALLQPPTAASTAGAAAGWKLTQINTGMTHWGSPTLVIRQAEGPDGALTVAAVAASPTAVAAVVQLTAPSVAALAVSGPDDWQMIRSSSAQEIPDGYVSVPEALEFPTTFDDKSSTAHMLFYPPTNKDFTYPPGQLPPLLVKSHGGPTSSAVAALSAVVQYWTSRGFAVADVDYGGSTGYGREYRNRLNGRWGVVDVKDCCSAADWLATAGRVDQNRLCIAGGSAGGFTTLACLAFSKTFSAGASHYGVADLKLLADHTHKFESRYLDMLLGPLPEAADVYAARSPLQHVDGFSAPIIFFQGDEDKVVPPEQAIAMHAAVKDAGLPTALVMLAGEQHGFRQAANIRTALDGELFFYGTVLGFRANMPPELPKIAIDNWPPQPRQEQGQKEGEAVASTEVQQQ